MTVCPRCGFGELETLGGIDRCTWCGHTAYAAAATPALPVCASAEARP